jgi:drug/metabolite transporter (DMT)-like permease
MVMAVFALASAAAWGTADFMGALRTRTYGPLLVAAFAQLTGAIVLVIPFAFFPDPFPGWHIWLWGIGAGVFGSVGHVVFYAALSRGPIGVIAPVLSMSVLGPVLWDMAVHGERPAPLQYAGIGACVVGVALVSRHADGTTGRHGRYGAVPLALLAVVIVSAFMICLDGASNQSAAWGVVAKTSVSLPILLVWLLIGVRRGAETVPRDAIRRIAPVGLLDTGGLVLFAYATSLGSLGLAVVLSNIYPVFTIGLARVRLGEHLLRMQQVGAGLAIAGAIAVVAG